MTADDVDTTLPRAPPIRSIGAISAHMTIIASYPIHVNGAYRDRRTPFPRPSEA